jgi:hypothetical protein
MAKTIHRIVFAHKFADGGRGGPAPVTFLCLTVVFHFASFFSLIYHKMPDMM